MECKIKFSFGEELMTEKVINTDKDKEISQTPSVHARRESHKRNLETDNNTNAKKPRQHDKEALTAAPNRNDMSKARPMNKDELNILIELIAQNKIFMTKATNASNKKLKEEAWKTIAHEFNLQVGVTRDFKQLRRKWKNVKADARKRTAERQNNLKTGGGNSPYEILDRVASVLDATCSGYTAEFASDGLDTVQGDQPEVVLPLLEIDPKPQSEADIVMLVEDGSGDNTIGGCGSDGIAEPISYVPKAVLYNTPKNLRNQRRKLTEEVLNAQKEKELKIKAYFSAKTEKVKLKTEMLKLEIELLKNFKS